MFLCCSPVFLFSVLASLTVLMAACFPAAVMTAVHAGSNTYQGSDGEWFYLACIDYRRFAELCELIGLPEIAKDPKYSTSAAYYANRTELTKIFDKKFAEQTVEYWDKLFTEHDMPHEVLAISKMFPMIRRFKLTIIPISMSMRTAPRRYFPMVRSILGRSIQPQFPARLPVLSVAIRQRSSQNWVIVSRKSRTCMNQRKSCKNI